MNKLEILIKKSRVDYSLFLDNTKPISDTKIWVKSNTLSLNSILAVGWINSKNDLVLLITLEGIFLYDDANSKFILEDYESDFKEYLTDDNLEFCDFSFGNGVYSSKVFGLRGGNGDHFSKDWTLKFYFCNPELTFVYVQESKHINAIKYYIEPEDLNLNERLFGGFSNNKRKFLICGQNFVSFYKKVE